MRCFLFSQRRRRCTHDTRPIVRPIASALAEAFLLTSSFCSDDAGSTDPKMRSTARSTCVMINLRPCVAFGALHSRPSMRQGHSLPLLSGRLPYTLMLGHAAEKMQSSGILIQLRPPKTSRLTSRVPSNSKAAPAMIHPRNSGIRNLLHCFTVAADTRPSRRPVLAGPMSYIWRESRPE